ncbi:PREDICTED: uncharacterized protein LOC107342112 [Acropora digitifera]|uniref:uncharacterized protein LOC107342112 n=1 Tax=Acropora digitifera TaxID=70779 RepID=UPI00077A93FA|nr:PREDICTED: uncharacterized protein LOC107342112 [Acropora digitifera]
MQGMFLKRMREEEATSGIECEELSEKDTLLEELSERERSFQVKEKNTAKDKEEEDESGFRFGSRFSSWREKITKNCYRGRRFLEGKGEVRANSKTTRNGIEKEGAGRESLTTTRNSRANAEGE